ncbi:hypothetical protein GIB67_026483 [Kingdonia uniflora]|uniref:Leucine-rich repeat-containing N-terminal plant-type domain-containing protein n=1 Tax=Kingdonia uniflora TaxID=39325 RepID=A0A7J7P6C2_9MAGN|nr:hypothetical protein GIB67_026483 [Kingdonia uniflora]
MSSASALKIMYGSLNSPPQLTGWSSTGDDPCGQSWKGVTCSGSAVTELKLSGLQLSGSMGFQLTNLKSLTNLDISNNNLGNQIPYQLPPNLQRLNLASNQFNGAIPYSISLMTTLKYLNLAHNQLQGQLGDMFGQLSSLNALDLSSNALTGDLPESFSSLTSVNSIYLQSNQFTGTIVVLENLPLQNLNVANNRFSGWIPGNLKKINNLQTDGNSWTTGPAPPPPPFTPPPGKTSPNKQPATNSNPSGANGGSKKSGIGGGAIAGIIISLLVVGAIVAFFLFKRRSRKRSSDVEKVEIDRPFTSLAPNEVQEMKTIQTPAAVKIFETSASMNLRPPPVDRHKSFDEEDFSNKPVIVVNKKAHTAPISATAYSVADLQMATGSFNVENLIGEGSIGRVYRAQFNDGKV